MIGAAVAVGSYSLRQGLKVCNQISTERQNLLYKFKLLYERLNKIAMQAISKMAGTKNSLVYRQFACTILNVTRPYEILVYSVLEHIQAKSDGTSSAIHQLHVAPLNKLKI